MCRINFQSLVKLTSVASAQRCTFSSGLILHYPVGPLLVQDAIPALSAPDDIAPFQHVLMAAVTAYVCYAIVGRKLLLLLGRQHCRTMTSPFLNRSLLSSRLWSCPRRCPWSHHTANIGGAGAAVHFTFQQYRRCLSFFLSPSIPASSESFSCYRSAPLPSAGAHRAACNL